MSEKISRREFHTRLAGTAAFAIAASASGGQTAVENTASVADKEIEQQLAEIQKQRSVPLTPGQRKSALDNLKDMQSTTKTIRKTHVEDTSEPLLIFKPIRSGKGMQL